VDWIQLGQSSNGRSGGEREKCGLDSTGTELKWKAQGVRE